MRLQDTHGVRRSRRWKKHDYVFSRPEAHLKGDEYILSRSDLSCSNASDVESIWNERRVTTEKPAL